MSMENIINPDALYEAMLKCKQGVMWKPSVASFILNYPDRIGNLHTSLTNGTYKQHSTIPVQITYPKAREACGVVIRDRVYQRSLNDNALYPAVTKSFIFANFACQKGKGTEMARDLFLKYLRNVYFGHKTGYVLKIDIKSYFDSLPHDYVEGLFKKALNNDDIFDRVKEVLDFQYSGETGYKPGSQMVQIAGIAALNPLDHFIKEKLRVKRYIRYMDDLILIHDDKDYLKYCLSEIKEYLERIGLKTHPKKTKIYSIFEEVMFLGFKFRVTNTGKVVILADPERVKSFRKKMKRLVKKCLNGEVDADTVNQSFECSMAHFSYGDSFKLKQKLNQFYKNLWKGE